MDHLSFSLALKKKNGVMVSKTFMKYSLTITYISTYKVHVDQWLQHLTAGRVR